VNDVREGLWQFGGSRRLRFMLGSCQCREDLAKRDRRRHPLRQPLMESCFAAALDRLTIGRAFWIWLHKKNSNE